MIFEAQVKRPVFGGEVLAYAPDGRITLFRGAAPGDQVRLQISQTYKRYHRAQLLKLLKPSPDRTAPFCAHFPQCGGCPWQAIPPEAQREALHQHLLRSLKPIEPSKIPLEPFAHFKGQAWRSTARVHCDGERLGFRRAGSSEILDLPHCPALRPELNALLGALRAAPSLPEGSVRLSAAPGASSGTLAFSAQLSSRQARALMAEPCIHGLSHSRGSLGSPQNLMGAAQVPHPATAFLQAHQEGNQALVEAVLEVLSDAEHILELFCGSGNFSLPLLEAGHRLSAIERAPEAVKALQREAERRAPGQALVLQGEARKLPQGPFDAALLDPPRRGAAQALRALHELGLRRLLYLSCEPSTLSRDLRLLFKLGWRLTRLKPFDLFPHTGHMETLALLKR